MTETPPLTRRLFLGGLAFNASLLAGIPAYAQQGSTATIPDAPAAGTTSFGPERHGLSAMGDLKYPPDFAHFEYANPDAPKGGMLSLVGDRVAYNQSFETFNSLNMFVFTGTGAMGLDLTFASLMAGSLDEPGSAYGLIAQSVSVSEDGLRYRFRLRREATFHDDMLITAEDVAFSLRTLQTEGHPLITQLLTWMESVEVLAEREVLITFRKGRSRELPLFVASLPIFSRAFFSNREFNRSTQEPILGSGPYRVSRFEQGRFIEYERITDWWGDNLPAIRGQYNFARVRYDYYRDRDIAFEAFKARQYLFREDFTSRHWNTGYDFPAARDGRVVRDEIPDGSPSGGQGWLFNTRRDKFKDIRVREALVEAFDFEWINANIMYNSYVRTASYFENSPLKAEGLPSPEELKLLAPFRGKVPDTVFGEPVSPPVSDGSGRDRARLRRATELLREAGWTIQEGVLRNADRQAFTIEFLDTSPGLEPHLNAYIANLKRIGIEATIRYVDGTQYQSRTNDYDFDVISLRLPMSLTPGDGLKLVFGSAAGKRPGSRNMAGIDDPAVDAMLEAIIAAETREELTTACHALDRLIRAGHYWVPAWYKPTHWLAYWDVYERPEILPPYARGVLETWWWNTDKARKFGL